MQVHNILIADDDAEDSEFFTTAVAQINPDIHVTVAGSTKELFHHLKQSVPDLLFIDSFIPHESGLASIKELRANERFKHLPIVMYTGSADVKNIANAFNTGASAYIVKPHTLAEIKQVLQVIFDKDWSRESSMPQQYYLDGQFRDLKA